MRKRSGKKIKKSSKERRQSLSKKQNSIKQPQIGSMSSSNLHCDDKIKQMIEYLQYKNGKSSIINQKATPRSGSNFGSAFPTQVYSSTFSPNSNKSGKRVRNPALSPSIMSKDVYSVTHQR